MLLNFFLVGAFIFCTPLCSMEFSDTFSFGHDIGTSLIQFPSRPAKYETGGKVTLDWRGKGSRARLTWNAIPVDPNSQKQIEQYFDELGALILGKKPGQVNTSRMKIEIKNQNRDSKSPVFSLPVVLKLKSIVKD